MKKEILAMMACGMMMTSAYAQEIKNGDFESGDLTSWNVWEKKDNKIVDAKKAHSGNYAVEVKVGMWQAVNISYETGAEYQISAYTKYSWGDKPNFRIEYYNPDSKKLEEIATAEVKKGRKNYNLTTVKFKLQENGFVYRFTAVPGSGNGGCFLLDDVKIEKVK